MAAGSEETRLHISRHACRLFLDRGIANVNGFDIAAAAGVSKRTLWRYFRTKESCVEPILSQLTLLIVAELRHWPRDRSIEDYLATLAARLAENRDDRMLAVHIIAQLPDEPALRSAWLMACGTAERHWIGIIQGRVDPATDPLRIRMCAAAIMGAIRVFDEQSCYETVREGRRYGFAEGMGMFAAAVREVSILPICDAM